MQTEPVVDAGVTADSGKFPLSTRGKLFCSYLYHLRQVHYGKAGFETVQSGYTSVVSQYLQMESKVRGDILSLRCPPRKWHQ